MVIDTQRGHLGGWIIVDQEVSPCYQAGKRLLVLAEVQDTSTLVGIQIQKEPTLLRVYHPLRKGSSLAGTISTGFFHFDDVCAEVGHQFGGIRRRDHMPQFEHLHAFESLHVSPSFSVV